MPSKQPFFPPRRDTYRWRTHRPLHCLIFVAPLLALFHLGSVFGGTSLLASPDLARLLGLFGSTARFLPPVVIVVVLLIQQAARRERWQVQTSVLAGMVIESLLWAVCLFAVHYLCARLISAQGMLAAADGGPTFELVLQAVGAGVYEEFLFRLASVGVVIWLFSDLFGLKKDPVTLVALVAAALAFSLYHFSWSADSPGGTFTWGLFIWRFAAGLCLGVVYVYRGFGIAVGAHTLWNLYYVMASS